MRENIHLSFALILSYSAFRAQILEILRTFKNENAEKYGILRMVLPNSFHEAEVQGSSAPYLVEFFELVFREGCLSGPAAAFYLAGVDPLCKNTSHNHC